MQKRLGYSDAELAEFRKNPRNEDVLDKGGQLSKKLSILEAVEASGCNSRHKAGDEFYLPAPATCRRKWARKNPRFHSIIGPAPDLRRQRNALCRDEPERDALPADRLHRRRPAVRRVAWEFRVEDRA